MTTDTTTMHILLSTMSIVPLVFLSHEVIHALPRFGFL